MDLSLRHRLTALVACLILAIASGFGLYFPHRMAQRGQWSVEQRALAVITVVASAETPALDFDDPEIADRDLAYLADTSDAVWAAVWRRDGTRFAAWNGDRVPASALAATDRPEVRFVGDLAIATAPLATANGPLGSLSIGFSLRQLHADARADWLAVLAMCGLALGLGTAGAYAIGSVLIRPVQRISRAARRVADGDVQLERLDLDHTPGSRTSRDEVAQLTAAVTDMARRLADQVRGLSRARAAAERAEERATAASAAKSIFLANMSHELRTPLNAIIGYSEILTDETDDPAVRADLEKIHASATHLFGLISGILDISKIEAGRMEIAVDEWDLPPVVREVVASVQGLAAKNRSTVTVGVAPDVGRVVTDAIKVRQILLNLLSNAVKFTEDGVVRLEVSRRVDGAGRPWVALAVTDSGIGMTEEQLGRVFQPFTQADPSTTKRFGGTGLGLTITQRFCAMLGGTLTVVSELGVGSTFTVELPEQMSATSPLTSVGS